jgi:LPXTG-site transpeptidase (sortase) family protein
MAVYIYKKQKPQYMPLLAGNGSISTRRKDPIWQFIKKRKKEQLMLAGVLSIAGLVLLASQLIPMGYSKLEENIIRSGVNDVKSPVTSTYAAERQELAYYDLSHSYFRNLVESIQGKTDLLRTKAKLNKDLVIDETYSKAMKLTIDSVGIKDLTITPNVDSYDEKVYNLALKGGAAHFKGTVLPGDNDYGNFVVYGHSALPSFFERNPNYKETEFTKIHKMRVGDKIQVVREGETYEYVVSQNKIVKPNEFDALSGIEGESTITLITCFPAGDPSGRWITIAREID